MAKKATKAKPEGLDLATELRHLNTSVSALQRAIAEPTQLTHKIEQLNGMLDIVAKRHGEILSFLGRVTFPAAALAELTGELRALRWLLDKTGEFRYMDKERAKPGNAGEAGEPQTGEPVSASKAP